MGWYESGKRKTKALPSKALADHYRQIKHTQLNSDVFIGTITVDWRQMRDEYQHSKKVAGNEDVSIYETALTLRHFERLVGSCTSKQMTQNSIDQFILDSDWGYTMVEPASPAQTESETDPLVLKNLERFKDMKFGLMIHWGVYSICEHAWTFTLTGAEFQNKALAT